MARPSSTTAPLLQPIRLDFDDHDTTDVSRRLEKTVIEENMTVVVRDEYQPRTLGEHNIQRLSVLPIYPPYSPATPTTTTPRKPHLLLANVPIELLTEEQYNRLKYDAYPSWFQLELNTPTPINLEKIPFHSSESFFIGLYQKLYLKMKKRLKVDVPIIDYNLKRVEHCLEKIIAQRQQPRQTMLNLDELALALEFFLQFDVDLFYLKTCSFHGVKPRLFENRFYEGLFCIEPPEPRFSITPCNQRHCLLCHPPCPRRWTVDRQQASILPFSKPHIHRFVNQYEAILNCPATCTTDHCVYVLTCPCGQYDFVGVAERSFADTFTEHRDEGNRIIREFLLGETNTESMTYGLKSEAKRLNDRKWLYQHSPRCSVALQLFLDYNPEYWCLVPMKLIEVSLANSQWDASLVPSSMETSWTRNDDEVRRILENLPKPPLGFDFSIGQRHEQRYFFKWSHDRIVPRDQVDLYNANILAVLPSSCSELFQQFIESLFITHAECKLNERGHLIDEPVDPNVALQPSWCANLTGRPWPSAS